MTERILAMVADHFGCKVSDFRSSRRHRSLSRARWVAALLLREHCMASYPQIGRWLNKDHSTIMHGYRRMAELLREDADLRAVVDALRNRIDALHRDHYSVPEAVC